jgi:hypothetical protein
MDRQLKFCRTIHRVFPSSLLPSNFTLSHDDPIGRYVDRWKLDMTRRRALQIGLTERGRVVANKVAIAEIYFKANFAGARSR